jgi:hypothetical protein
MDPPEVPENARARKVAEEICVLRWASISGLYRQEVLGRKRSCHPVWAESDAVHTTIRIQNRSRFRSCDGLLCCDPER